MVMFAMSIATDEVQAPPATFSGRLTCRTADGVDPIKELRAAWESLGGWAPSPMETFGWAAAAAQSLTDEQTPRLLLAERDGRVCGIGQLAVCRGSLSGRLEMIGMTRLNEPSDFLYADRDALAALVRRAIRIRRPIFLGRLPAES